MSKVGIPTWLEWAQALAAISVPLLIAIGGYVVQTSVSEAQASVQYVSLAISILKEPAKTRDEPLRAWAVNLLQENSPTKLTPELVTKLKSGDVTFAGLALSLSGTAAASVAAEGVVTVTK